MYCPDCGEEIEDDVKFCPECGYSIEGGERVESSNPGEDYDIAMSVEDAISRRNWKRMVVDVIALFGSVGFYGGWLAIQFLMHHRNIKNGETEPYEEGDEKQFWIAGI